MSTVPRLRRHGRVLLFSALALMLSACVTTETGGFAEKANERKAYETSLQLAKTYIANGNWQQAKRHLKYVESVDKNNPETLEALALVYQNTGELEMAEKYYRRAIEQDPEVMRIRNNYAAYLYEQARYSEAAAQLEIVVSELLYERRVDAFVNLGRCYLKLDELDRAEEAFKRALLMERDDPTVVLSMAEVSFRRQDYPQAQRYYDAFQQMNPRQSAAALWLGIRLAKVFDDQDAYASYALALKNLYPKSEEYLRYKASLKNGGGE